MGDVPIMPCAILLLLCSDYPVIFLLTKAFPWSPSLFFQVYSCANNWLISCGSLEMSRCEVAFVVQHFGKTFLHLYTLGHEVRLVLTQLALFRRAFWVSALPAYETCSTSTPRGKARARFIDSWVVGVDV